MPETIHVAAEELQPRLIGIALRELRKELAAVRERHRFAAPPETANEPLDGDEETFSWPLRTGDAQGHAAQL